MGTWDGKRNFDGGNSPFQACLGDPDGLFFAFSPNYRYQADIPNS
jgi:hypothetical protein